MKWPSKRKARRQSTRHGICQTDRTTAREYHGHGLVQTGIIWNRWHREAQRLFGEYWPTADDRHLEAFATHIRAMRIRALEREVMNKAEAANVDGHECVVLSALMNGADALPVCADDFASSPNRMIFNRISGLLDRGLIAVTDELRLNGELEKVGGAGRITEIATMPHDEQNLKYALDQVLEHSQARQAAKIGERMHKGEIDPGEALKQLESLNRHTRRPHIDIGRQGSAVEFPDVVLWETPVNGADVLSEIAATFSRYLALPVGAADVLALWTAHAHAFEAFVHTPRLNLCSPDKGCGKTTALDVLASVTPRPLRTESMTAAVLFRLVEQYKPTLLLDEVDAYLNEAEELRGLLNAGHKRGAKAYRCEGENNTVRGFAAFAPAALAGIGALPGTLHDRSNVIKLVRAKPGEIAARFDSRRSKPRRNCAESLPGGLPINSIS